MVTKEEYAQLSLYVYNVKADANQDNRPLLPDGWERLEYYPDNLVGLSYGVFRRIGTSEIVLAYAGSNEKLFVDYAGTNFPAAMGLGSLQLPGAALAYERVLETYGTDSAGSNISFTGHSLGGGLASVMAVWYNRPAVVFDEAPFQLMAISHVQLAAVRAFLALHGYYNGAMDDAISGFTSREQNVANYFLQGELLESIRVVFPAVAGSIDQHILANVADINNSLGDRIALHSQALLTAMLLSNTFRQATFASTRVIPLLMDERLYAYDAATSDQRNVLIDLIRSEQGTGDKLTHFAADLNKLGANIAGLTTAAQDAVIAQGIEWYYWQGSGYAGAEFFTRTGELLQYTTARGDGLPGALNKAASYVGMWLTPIANDHGEFYSSRFANYDQWSVATGSTGSTANALDATKSQIFVGGAGADAFTGGNLGDVIFAGAGADTLIGGAGADKLYGGTGADTYTFSGLFGSDKIEDHDISGLIQVTGLGPLSGAGAKKNSATSSTWQSDDKRITYTLINVGTATAPRTNLVISVAANAADANAGSITIQNWVEGELGITLGSEVAAPQTSLTLAGDFAKATTPDGTAYYTTSNGYVSAGALADAPDVINGSAEADTLSGLGGNDGIAGHNGDDVIDGGAGDDLLLGGTGYDTINGGAGNDTIFGSAIGLFALPGSVNFTPPAVPAGVERSRGFSWVSYRAPGERLDASGHASFHSVQVVGASTAVAWQEGQQTFIDLTGNFIDAGAGDDHIAAGTGADMVYGGEGDDDIAGMDDNDVLIGEAGADFIYGDGSADAASFYQPTYTPASRHGDDLLSGGAGNDVMAGQGGSDELYGVAGRTTNANANKVQRSTAQPRGVASRRGASV